MKNITLASFGVPDIDAALEQRIMRSAQKLHDGTGEGAESRGWMSLPVDYDQQEFARIKEVAAHVRDNAEVFITIGIGGSYLGSKAVICALEDTFAQGPGPKMVFAGNQLSSAYMQDLLMFIQDKSVYLNVISKSGTTLEPALAFRLLRNALEAKYGEDGARERIFVTTDAHKGALKSLAAEKGYETFVVPDDIGGRYSALTAVGLLPIAVSGIDIDSLMAGARAAMTLYSQPYAHNDCYQYSALRSALYEDGKKIEILVGYEPSLHYVGEWWKQLFGESEGKDGKGLYPSSMQFTTDLHSLGQYVQQGERRLFETVLYVEDSGARIAIPEDSGNHDGLHYLVGKTLDDANTAARKGVRAAHLGGDVPQISISVPQKNAYYLGQLLYFFEKACAVSAYTLGVNPFNQPGVEAYKKQMFTLLGKEH